MKPTVLALVVALVSGTAMFAVGRTSAPGAQPAAALVAPDPVAPAVGARTALQPVGTQPAAIADRQVSPVRRVSAPAPAAQRTVVAEQARPQRSWKTSALVIGGSAASGAGIGGALGGRKGAITGAAIGGGAASIYEAIRRQ